MAKAVRQGEMKNWSQWCSRDKYKSYGIFTYKNGTQEYLQVLNQETNLKEDTYFSNKYLVRILFISPFIACLLSLECKFCEEKNFFLFIN